MEDAYWRPYTNRKRRFKGNTRHFNQVCPYCSLRKKNINMHYKLYHPKELKEYNDSISKAFQKGEFGVISGVRFIKN